MLTSDELSQELKSHHLAGNWDEVLRILNLLEQQDSIDRSLAEYLRRDAWVEKIRQQADWATLSTCIDSIPPEIKRQRKVTAAMARALIKYERSEFARKLLTDSLNARWDGGLVALYGDCRSDDVRAQIEHAEKWLLLHRGDAALLLALGKLYLHEGLLQNAREYLTASINAKPSSAAHESMGQLAERMGDTELAQHHFQQARTYE